MQFKDLSAGDVFTWGMTSPGDSLAIRGKDGTYTYLNGGLRGKQYTGGYGEEDPVTLIGRFDDMGNLKPVAPPERRSGNHRDGRRTYSPILAGRRSYNRVNRADASDTSCRGRRLRPRRIRVR